MITSIEAELNSIYDNFLDKMGIPLDTGIIPNSQKRFAGCLYLGDKYEDAPIKILFISLDMGVDELGPKKSKGKYNTYYRFDDAGLKRAQIKVTPDFFKRCKDIYNYHISGLYSTALYILKDKISDWDTAWNEYEASSISQNRKLINHLKNQLPYEVMDYVAFSNVYKFVTVDREKRTGNDDRQWMDEAMENELLYAEIDRLNPDVIICQGSCGFYNELIQHYKDSKAILHAYHPSYWRPIKTSAGNIIPAPNTKWYSKRIGEMALNKLFQIK